VINHLIRCYALSWHPALWHMIYVAQWLLQTHSSSVTLRATQVAWTQMMATWDMRYIDEGFLVWIIPLTYQSRESIIWACTTSFVHTCIYRMFNIFIACLCVPMLSTPFSMHVFWFKLIDIHVFTHFGFTVVPLISFMLLVIACTCMPEPRHLIMYTCDCLSTPAGFIIYIRWVAFWQPWILMSRFWSLDRGGLVVADQSA